VTFSASPRVGVLPTENLIKSQPIQIRCYPKTGQPTAENPLSLLNQSVKSKTFVTDVTLNKGDRWEDKNY
jgi:hypothetical protein